MKKLLFGLLFSFNLIFSDCPHDLNGDGTANVVDIVALVNFVLNETCQELEGDCPQDFNDDGSINAADDALTSPATDYGFTETITDL